MHTAIAQAFREFVKIKATKLPITACLKQAREQEKLGVPLEMRGKEGEGDVPVFPPLHRTSLLIGFNPQPQPQDENNYR